MFEESTQILFFCMNSNNFDLERNIIQELTVNSFCEYNNYVEKRVRWMGRLVVSLVDKKK